MSESAVYVKCPNCLHRALVPAGYIEATSAPVRCRQCGTPFAAQQTEGGREPD